MKTHRQLYLGLLLVLPCLLLAVQAQGRYKRLTTFGKAPEKQSHPGKGKDCRTDRECPVEHSSCKDDTDGKRRCICDDGVYPVKGVCQHIREKRGYVPKGNGQTKEKDGCCGYLFKPATTQFFPPPATASSNAKPLFLPAKEIAIGLREACQSSTECISGAECKINLNATSPAMMKTKVCLCTEDTVEEDNECSGCVRLETNGWVFVVLGLSSIIAFQH